ncbi:hypothetical protein [uncultured Bifidobacterium sp.]|uniref:hypothetical protein n=1 Tax=uncultured Bifidobacterium sp. TaxID=165187 RepID=UPI00258D272D|nr:hypothetical protein [uncultured Bifidobacterium sp.]
MISVDTHQLDDLSRRLTFASARAPVKAAKAVKKGAQNIKTGIIADLASSSSPNFRKIPIAYDITVEGMRVEADIAPVKGAGGLANIAFFGSARGGGTHRFYEHGEAEFDTVAQYVAEAGESL